MREALHADLFHITMQLHTILEVVNQCCSCELVILNGEAVSDWNHVCQHSTEGVQMSPCQWSVDACELADIL